MKIEKLFEKVGRYFAIKDFDEQKEETKEKLALNLEKKIQKIKDELSETDGEGKRQKLKEQLDALTTIKEKLEKGE